MGAGRRGFGVVYLLDWLNGGVRKYNDDDDDGGDAEMEEGERNEPRGCELRTSQIASALTLIRSILETKSLLLRSRKMLSSAQWLSW